MTQCEVVSKFVHEEAGLVFDGRGDAEVEECSGRYHEIITGKLGSSGRAKYLADAAYGRAQRAVFERVAGQVVPEDGVVVGQLAPWIEILPLKS